MKLWQLVFLVAPLSGILTALATNNPYAGLLVTLLIASWGFLNVPRF